MPVLSIIACSMLEDELVHVVSKDSEIRQLIVVESKDSLRLLRKLKAKNCNPKPIFLDKIPMLLENKSGSDSRFLEKYFSSFPFFSRICANKQVKNLTVIVNLLKLNLHTDLELLKAEVYKNIQAMSSFSDNILIFYGTCGNSLGKLEKDFTDIGCKLSFLKDKNGEIVEDCISLALGGNENYARTMTEFRGMGTIYLTPMWASSWKNLGTEEKTRDFNSYYLKSPLYSLLAKIDTGIGDSPEFHKNVREFASTFKMKIVDLKGNLEVVEKSYRSARNEVTKT